LARGDPEEVALAALHDDRSVGASGGRPQAERSAGAPGGRPTGGRAPGAWRPGGYGGREAAEVERATGLPLEDIEAALAELVAGERAARVGPFYLAAEEWQRLRDDSARLLSDYHRQYPLRPGMPREEWRSRLGLSPRLASEVAGALEAAGELAEAGTGAGHGALLRQPDHEPRLSPEQQRAVDAMLARFQAAPFAPPTRAEVEQELGAELTAALVEQGTLVKVSDTVLLERGAYDEAIARIVDYLRAHGKLTVADARDLLDTSRKYMLAIFEHTDERRITRRMGDDRVLGPNAPATAPAPAASQEQAP
jgi:selenocysteine-specific elongation factor